MATSSSAMMKLDWTHAMTLVARLCMSAIFVISGVGKLMAPAGTIAAIESVGLPFPSLAFVTAIVVEVLGGAALAVGYKVRWTASILAAFTVVTALYFHSAFADPNQVTHFLKNVAMTGGLLQMIVAGKGAADRSC